MQTRVLEIPLNKLIPSATNVRRTYRDGSAEELAASIAAHGLLQSLNVRPELDEAGQETGSFRVSGGGRRLAALKVLAKRKVIGKTTAIPCVVSEGDEEEASLAENVVREQLHPADQFEAFKRLVDERGFGAEEIAARFGVMPQVVRQRMRLGSVSPKLMRVYRDGALTLEQMMAFAITEDHARQEQVHEALSWNKEPGLVRRMLTETQIPARDRRAVLVGAEAYTEAGGVIVRDLFTEDGGGWYADPALLDRLASERLEALANEVRDGEGWRWAQAHLDYPHAQGLRRVYPHAVALSEEDEARREAVGAEYDALEAQWGQAESLPEEVEAKLAALELEAAALSARTYAYDAEEIAHGGVLVCLNHDGTVRVERGFIRAEDEVEEEVDPTTDADGETEPARTEGETSGSPPSEGEAAEDDARPLSDLMLRDLTAHRTMALRYVLGEDPDAALVAVTHAMAAQSFFSGYDVGACLDIKPTSAPLGGHAAGVADGVAGRKLAERHEAWARQMPRQPGELWAFVVGLDSDSRSALFAHCTALTLFAVCLPWDRKTYALATADALAARVGLDMSAFWTPTADSYFGRVTKAEIVCAVREGVSDEAAQRIAGCKKPDMAQAAESLLAGTGWLPDALRTAAEPTGMGEPAASQTYAYAAE